MAAILPGVFDAQDETRQEDVDSLLQSLDQRPNIVKSLSKTVDRQKAVFDVLITKTDQADRAEERRAYRAKLRRQEALYRASLAKFIEVDASQMHATDPTVTYLKSLLTQIATDEGTTLADLLTAIGS